MVFEENFIVKGLAARIKPQAFCIVMIVACHDHLEYEEKPNREELQKLSGLGRDATKRAIKRAKEDHLIEMQQRNESGKFGRVVYGLTEYAKMYFRNFLPGQKEDTQTDCLPQNGFKSMGGSPSAGNQSLETSRATENPPAGFTENLPAVSLYSKLVVVEGIIYTTIKGDTENLPAVPVKDWLSKDEFIVEQLKTIYRIPQTEIENFAKIFLLKKADKKEKTWPTMNECRKHFLNWLPYYLQSSEYEKGTKFKQQTEATNISLPERLADRICV